MEFRPKLDGLIVVLVAPRNPLNIGAAARAMRNFGSSTLRVVNPYEVAFRDARSAVGAEDLLAQAELFSSLAEAVADSTLVVGTVAAGHREPVHVHRPLAEAAGLIEPALAAGGRVALLFGSEKRGLANEDLAHCNWLLHIPTEAAQPSMNLGQAVAVCLYELARSPRNGGLGPTAPPLSPTAATAAELERVTEILLDALELSGYTLPRQAGLIAGNARRLIRRLNLESEDANLLLGMLRQIVWKLRSGGK